MSTFTSQSRVVATQEQVSTDLAGKTAILHLKNNTYYSLDEVGTALWDLLRQERSVEELGNAIADRYGISREQCDTDILVFLQQLDEHNLIKVK